MRFTARGLIGLLWLAATAGALSAATEPAAVAESGSTGLFTLACDNGLMAVIETRPGSRTVFAEIGVRVGSRDEPPRLAGMSHLLEHMLFKEGHDAGARANPAFSALRGVGAIVNASTDFELTEYHADLPAGSFEQGWEALVSLVTRAAFTAEDLERERRVVLQEAALGKIDPVAVVAWSVLGRIFPGDPIGQPVIGFRRSLRRIALSDLDGHYRRHYTPANMFAVIVGDVEAGQAAKRVRATLCALPSSGGAHPPYVVPATRARPLYRFRTLVRQSYLLAGSLTAGETSPDAVALEVITTLLGEGRSSRLYRRLVQREALTDEVTALALQVSDTGAVAAGLAVAPRLAERARGALASEILRLAAEPVTRDELDSARNVIRGRLARWFETNEGIAGFRAHRLLLRQPVGRDDYLARLDAIGPDDLLDVARRHWGGAGAGGTAPGLIEIQVLPARGFGRLIAALKFVLFRRL